VNVIDLYAGTGSMSIAFAERGHNVFRVEKDPSFGWPSIDARAFAKDPYSFLPWREGETHVVMGGPPCTAFSMAGKGSAKKGNVKGARWLYAEKGERYPFYGPRYPNDDVAREGCELVLAFLRVVKKTSPRFWFMENPMGGLNTMGFVSKVPRVIVTYCAYGDSRMKPTTIYGNFPREWTPRPRCKNGDSCHEAAPRGAKTGTQGITGRVRSRGRWIDHRKARAVVPYELSRELVIACETTFPRPTRKAVA
jgi:C-5 cytosine-specific DNA methylase